MMGVALINYLLEDAAITSLVDRRISWAIRPQSQTVPDIVLFTVDGRPEYDDEGDAGISQARIQVDCRGSSWLTARQVSDAVKTRMRIEFSTGGVEFQSVSCEDEQDSFERDAADVGLFRVRLDFLILYKEQ